MQESLLLQQCEPGMMRSLFVSFFGVFPAFLLCIPLVGAAFGSLHTFGESSDLGDLLGVVLFFTGLMGACALLFSVHDKSGPVGMFCLLLGIFTVLKIDLHAQATPFWQLFILSPLVVATFLISEGLYGLTHTQEEDDENPF